MFFASETVSTADADAASELARLEAQPEIDAVMPLPPRWKLSPLLLGDDGHDDDTTPDALKTLKVRVADRAKAHHGDAVSTTASTLTAPQRFTMAELSSQLIDVLRNFEYPAFSSSSSSGTGTPTPTYPFFQVASAGAEAASLFGDDVARAEHAAESSDWLVVDNVPALHLDAIALHIATQFAPALRIEPTLLHLTSNAWARWVTQSYTNAANDPTLNVLPVGTRTTVWDRGIQGENQIVGVGDSGLAVKNCQFVDPGRPVGLVQTGTTLNDNAHRKVIQYVAYADGGAGDNEDHGTHVSGSVAGKTPQGGKLGAYDGMAPEAKLAFFDIGRPGERGLRVPNDLATSFFPLAYGVGAKIHTNSWGSNTATYTASSRSLDRFMFDNQDFLVLVAAGNSGRDGAGSVGSPATAKSALSVGASLGTQESFQKNNVNNPPCGGGACTENMASFSSLGPLPSDSRLKPEVSAPGALTWSARSNTLDVYQCPNSEQESAQWTEQQINAVIFPTQGTSMATPTTAGNAALVRQYFTDGWYPRGSADAAQAQLPTGALLKAVLINSAQPMTGNHGNQALGGGQAGNLPAATGARARAGANIVRSRPTYAQRNLNGFGLTVLDRTLAFADSTGASVVRQDLFAVGFMGDASGSGLSQASLKTGDQPDEYTFTIKAAPPGAGAIPFKATLVWTDAPAATSAGNALVNDLDLEVTVTGPAGAPDLGTVYVPNGFAQSEVDSINPTEQVRSTVCSWLLPAFVVGPPLRP